MGSRAARRPPCAPGMGWVGGWVGGWQGLRGGCRVARGKRRVARGKRRVARISWGGCGVRTARSSFSMSSCCGASGGPTVAVGQCTSTPSMASTSCGPITSRSERGRGRGVPPSASVSASPSASPLPSARLSASSCCRSVCMVKGGEMGGFGGGWLEHPRQWPGAQWVGLSPGSGEPARAVRCALKRRNRSRARALPRGHFAL